MNRPSQALAQALALDPRLDGSIVNITRTNTNVQYMHVFPYVPHILKFHCFELRNDVDSTNSPGGGQAIPVPG